MENDLYNYFADELTSEAKEAFLMKVDSSEELREDFIEYQNLLGLIDWTISTNDEELAQRKLSEFMRNIENRQM